MVEYDVNPIYTKIGLFRYKWYFQKYVYY